MSCLFLCSHHSLRLAGLWETRAGKCSEKGDCAGAAVAILLLLAAAWVLYTCCKRNRQNRPQPPSPIYITGSEVGRDPALRNIGRPVKTTAAGAAAGSSAAGGSSGSLAQNFVNPMRAAFEKAAPRKDRGGKLLSGQLSSTAGNDEAAASEGVKIVPLPGTPPRTAAEALAHMERQVAEQEQGSNPAMAEGCTAFTSSKPEVQVGPKTQQNLQANKSLFH